MMQVNLREIITGCDECSIEEPRAGKPHAGFCGGSCGIELEE